jgi:outer membrane biosynthesis protein TonB
MQKDRTTMATKRKHEESEQQEAVHAERQAQVYGSNPKPAKKPRRIESTAPKKKQAHASSVNAIKKRIRDVRRRLERADDLPADVRIENERALAAYEQELVAALAEKTRQKMIKKYHMVRFFGMAEYKLPLVHSIC